MKGQHRSGKPARPSSPRKRLRLPAISEQMKAWTAALAADLETWPRVKTRHMFGFTAWYRGSTIFAVLPKTRGLGAPNSVAFKLPTPGPRLLDRMRKEPRIGATQMQNARWFTFELGCDTDLHDALEWLGRAYEAAN